MRTRRIVRACGSKRKFALLPQQFLTLDIWLGEVGLRPQDEHLHTDPHST